MNLRRGGLPHWLRDRDLDEGVFPAADWRMDGEFGFEDRDDLESSLVRCAKCDDEGARGRCGRCGRLD